MKPWHTPDLTSNDITSESIYLRRRELIAVAGLTGIGLATMPSTANATALKASRNAGFVATDKETPFESASTYNNFYEFGTDKADPAKTAQKLVIAPWQLRVEGECLKPKTFDLDELMKLAPLEERVYRLRCVEGWSMVIPWIGYSLSALINAVQPKGNAKYVEFLSLADPKQMPGVASRFVGGGLDWPYAEGLRLDEAMHPLTLLTLGMYGQTLPRQNGAPVRLTVPWKYGFKSAKSIVTIRLTEKQPGTAWNKAIANEYGFYSNVNPTVDHPRWSQATERRLPESNVFTAKRKTLMFNGYDQVASLYTGMDLKKNF
jgi:methionine sulfoxide reductase catalytic subunit